MEMTPMSVNETPGHLYCGNTLAKKWNSVSQSCYQKAIFKAVSKSYTSILVSNVGDVSTGQHTRLPKTILPRTYWHRLVILLQKLT